MDNRKIDHTVAQAILHYMLSDEGTHMGLAWGELEPDEIKRRLSADADKHNYVAVSPLFQWLSENVTCKMIGCANDNLTKFRYLVSRAAVRSPLTEDKSPMGDTLAERACVSIYLRNHVSDVPDDLQEAFDAGYDIYNSRKRVSES